MHEHVLIARDLWKLDAAIDAARAALAELGAAERQAAAEVERSEQALARARAELQRLGEEERALYRRLDDYTRRRDATRAMIDEGRAPDFLAAERQYEQCAEIVDDIETALLEMMESRDEVEGRIARGEIRLKLARQSLAEARARRVEEEPRRRAEIEALSVRCADRRALLPDDLREHYDDLRRRRQAPLADIRDGACDACHVTVPAQVQLEVKLGRRPHTCRACGRILVEVVEDEEAET